jgi:hypothetical protein
VICLRLLRTNSPETSSTQLLGLVKVRVQACPAASRAHNKFRATACPVASGARDKVRAQACPARDRVGAEGAQLHPELAIWLGSIVHTVTTTWERSTVDEEEKEKKEEEG